ncbi:MAG: hypothetical protein V4622_01930 [Bacteroidota bacterium]
MKQFFRSKWFKIPFYFFVFAFAIIGFGLTTAYFAIYYKWTDEGGAVDKNSRYLQSIDNEYKQDLENDSLQLVYFKQDAINRISILNKYYPTNAQQILHVFQNGDDVVEVLRMLDAADLHLKKNKSYFSELKKYKQNRYKFSSKRTRNSVYEWMNMSEWTDFKIAVEKDRALIDSVAKMTDVEARLIVSCLVGEQIRLFNSDREAYKKWIGPLKILSVESKFSLGVTGIKELTAQQMEGHLKDSLSEYYLGEKYEKLLDFKTEDVQQERFDRLTSFRNHFYSYLYAAVFIKQVKVQWEKKGFPIDKRPEILATLFNVGYPQSVPKSNPKVGGSTIVIKEKPYTFGMIAYQFYYSGELFDLFPIQSKKFDWEI